MLVIRSRDVLQEQIESWKRSGKTVGFVPTMGALHEGHVSLIDMAQRYADRCVVSIFVNPTQFAPNEDFNCYPREEQQDLDQCEAKLVDVVYIPSAAEIYPDGQESTVKAGTASQGLESDFRPHFFDGVVNVVQRLFNHVKPDIAVFGEKDYQQLMVIREMVTDLALPIEILGAPIKRDSHGLALSSRNAYLSADELTLARQLNKILRCATDEAHAKNQLLEAGFDKVEYVTERWNRLFAAAWVGKTRLIDNLG